jgi:hypothetical protein
MPLPINGDNIVSCLDNLIFDDLERKSRLLSVSSYFLLSLNRFDNENKKINEIVDIDERINLGIYSPLYISYMPNI